MDEPLAYVKTGDVISFQRKNIIEIPGWSTGTPRPGGPPPQPQRDALLAYREQLARDANAVDTSQRQRQYAARKAAKQATKLSGQGQGEGAAVAQPALAAAAEEAAATSGTDSSSDKDRPSWGLLVAGQDTHRRSGTGTGTGGFCDSVFDSAVPSPELLLEHGLPVGAWSIVRASRSAHESPRHQSRSASTGKPHWHLTGQARHVAVAGFHS